MEEKQIADFLDGYEKQYFLKYHDGIPLKWGGVLPKDRENVYKQALEEGKTWREITGFNPPKDCIL